MLAAIGACYLLCLAFLAMAKGEVFEPSDIFKNLQKGDRVAILMVHFGTTHDDTRAQTIDAINLKAQEHFPDVEVREAYTSRIIIKRLAQRGILKLNPLAALSRLKADGYTHILVQPTTIIDGVEMESLNRNVAELRHQFKEVRVGTPLLFYADDYIKVIDALTQNGDDQTAYLWVGHGTYDVSTAQYAMLDHMLKYRGHNNYVVGCIEGYPFYEQALSQLQGLGLKRVVLVPFMFVAGEHAKNDIAVDWKAQLEEAGFQVEVSLQGLGQVPAIQNRFIEILEFNARNRRLDIMDKKREYEAPEKARSEISSN